MALQNINNERALLDLLSKGSEDAFTQLFHRYRGMVYGVALHILKSPPMAEEIVQDTFLKVWLKRGEALSILDFEAYLFTMTRNLVFDRLKKISYELDAKQALPTGPAYTEDADHRLRHHQYQQLLQAAINQLPPQQKQVYELAKVEGLSHEAIARKLNLARPTVKKHMALALQFIRQFLSSR